MSSEAGILLSNTDCAVLQDHCALLQLGKQGRSKGPYGKRQGISYQLCQEAESWPLFVGKSLWGGWGWVEWELHENGVWYVNQTVKTLTEMDWDHNWAILGKFELCSWWKRIRRDTEHFKQVGRKGVRHRSSELTDLMTTRRMWVLTLDRLRPWYCLEALWNLNLSFPLCERG